MLSSSPSVFHLLPPPPPLLRFLFEVRRSFSGHGGRRTNTSRSLPRQFKGAFHPEVLNRKVYWWSEHKPIRRSVYTLLTNHFELKQFSRLCTHPSIAAAALTHELTSAGPFTAFLPTDGAMQKCHPSSLQKLYDNSEMLTQFVKHHFVRGHWKFRDIIGSCVQPWKVYNHPRDLPSSSISTMADEPLPVARLQPASSQLMELTLVRSYDSSSTATGGQEGGEEEGPALDESAWDITDNHNKNSGIGLHDWKQLVRLGDNSRLYRPEMRCHNGIVHLIDEPLVPPSWRKEQQTW
eukprot:GHVS01026548.1.p1 GENE.GHVS01026548.1~~GHVS01026548.1.p1  ORF type:complete len:293 (-),score=81.30 GHVS01026548.1:123-1001(-)